MSKKKEPVKLFVIRSGVSTSAGFGFRADAVLARSIGEAKIVIDQKVGLSSMPRGVWTSKNAEVEAALIRLVRRYPEAAEELADMVSRFMDTNDGTSRG